MIGLALAAALALGLTLEVWLLWASGSLLAAPDAPPEPLLRLVRSEADSDDPPPAAPLWALGLALAALAVTVGLALGVGMGLLRVLPRG